MEMGIRLAVILVLAVILAGCGDDTGVSTTVTTVVLTTTVAPTTTTSASSVWDVVALGDSLVAGWGVRSDEPYTPEEAFPGVYARSLGEELGVETVLHSYFPDQLGNEVRTVAEWNAVLASDEQMQADLQGAEVVVIWLGYHNIVPALVFGSCGSEWPEPLRTCLQEATETMPADFDELLGTIQSLVPEGTVVMIGNQAVAPMQIEDWGSQPFWPELRAFAFDGWWEGIETAAAAHGAIVVHSAEALCGPDGNQILHPNFVLPDELHLNAAGHRFLADLFLAADGLGD
jgi:lysophospholipase L1-like esterase